MATQKSLRVFLYDALLPLNALLHGLCALCGLRTACKFPIHCSQFAREELKKPQSLWRSFGRIMLRLLACSPLYGFLARRGLLNNFY